MAAHFLERHGLRVIERNFRRRCGEIDLVMADGETLVFVEVRLRRALDEFVVEGVETTLPLFRTLVRNSDVQNGQYDVHWLEDFLRTEPKADG